MHHDSRRVKTMRSEDWPETGEDRRRVDAELRERKRAGAPAKGALVDDEQRDTKIVAERRAHCAHAVIVVCRELRVAVKF